MIHGIIFDLGWTLMHNPGNPQENEARASTCLVEFLRAHGVVVSEDFPAQFHTARERGWKIANETGVERTGANALADVLASLGYSSLDGLLTRANDIFFGELERHWLAYADAIATLQTLTQRGLQVGIFSNADDDGLVQRAAVRLGFAPYVKPVLSSAAPPLMRKPDPRALLQIAAEWNLPASEIAMVGDAPSYDILGGNRAGMRTIWIKRDENFWWQKIPEELSNDRAYHADVIVKSLAEIPIAIETI